jgi:hypothetical protein
MAGKGMPINMDHMGLRYRSTKLEEMLLMAYSIESW